MSIDLDTIILAEVSEDQLRLSKEANQSVWSALLDTANNSITADNFLGVLRPYEDEYMEAKYSTVPEARHSSGQWKYREFGYVSSDGKDCKGGLPPCWSSNKSVLKNGLEFGVDLSTATTKKEVSDGYSAAKAGSISTSTQSPLAQFRKLMEKALKVYPIMTSEDQAHVRNIWDLAAGVNWKE